ncbi:WhiB family transcription factor [Gordonia phage Forza]|uniref:WhiB family transcription factor n=1 Tax=Gordonia phage Forza TaxID=2571247 RepID=A0A650EY26_9CAUD|nr:WhiB transcriptional factor [Gordonia phage Forza]QEM41543.1 WhiB family transcription factor [Gordonia phage Boopy]QGT55067.1 WhiB family transcription factor [Gordonia phage Forza]UXE04216.1 WhiB family transcription factor [Gordonia phage BlueNGold]WBF03855.1 WhiB family transcription factor [Gordonia phage Mareelih]
MVALARSLRSESYGKGSAQTKSFSSELAAIVSPWPKDLPNGLCKNAPDPDIWANPFEDDELAEAKSICQRCPIQFECLRIGIQRKDEGVYGGELLHRGAPTVLPKYRRKK